MPDVDIDSFFYVCSWLAVETADHEEVARLLGAAERRACGLDAWMAAQAGPRTGRDEGFFVCEPVDGWTLVFGEAVGLGIPAEVRARKFAQVHAFHLDDKRGSYFCERAIDGATVREVAEADGEYSAEGTPDAGEPELPGEGDERPIGRVLSQETVLRIAEAWGADPTQIAARVRAGLWCRSAATVQSAAAERRSRRVAATIAASVIAACVAALTLMWR